VARGDPIRVGPVSQRFISPSKTDPYRQLAAAILTKAAQDARGTTKEAREEYQAEARRWLHSRMARFLMLGLDFEPEILETFLARLPAIEEPAVEQRRTK
jgi:hypothetical protein